MRWVLVLVLLTSCSFIWGQPTRATPSETVECTATYPIIDVTLAGTWSGLGILFKARAEGKGEYIAAVLTPAMIIVGLVHAVSAVHGFSKRSDCVRGNERAGRALADCEAKRNARLVEASAIADEDERRAALLAIERCAPE